METSNTRARLKVAKIDIVTEQRLRKIETSLAAIGYTTFKTKPSSIASQTGTWELFKKEGPIRWDWIGRVCDATTAFFFADASDNLAWCVNKLREAYGDEVTNDGGKQSEGSEE